MVIGCMLTMCNTEFPSVSFDSTSQGQLAMVIYEWKDAKYLGKVHHSDMDNELPVSLQPFSFMSRITSSRAENIRLHGNRCLAGLLHA
jgi:hypothetical protein